MKPRLVTARLDSDDRWACSGCGARHRLEVIRTEHDEDGYPIRIRRCRNCKTPFATEETPIPLSSFYGRAASHTERSKKADRRKFSTCQRCLAAYPPKYRVGTRIHNERDRCQYRHGSYSSHVRTPYHQATLKHPTTDQERASARQRARRRYWKERGVDIDTASTGVALLDLQSDEDRMLTRIEDIPA